MEIVIAGIIGLAVLAGVALFAASGTLIAQKYLEPWKKDYASKYEDPRMQLAAHGLLAASGHNMQPWVIRLDQENKDAFYLYTDQERLTKEVDPFARQTLVSQGTFLEYAAIAGEKLGYETTIQLFPEGPYDEKNLEASMKEKPVARVILKKSLPEDTPLYDGIFLPDTNRGAYQPEGLTSEQVEKLQGISTDETLKVTVFQDEANKKVLGQFAFTGAKIESGIQRINEESGPLFRKNEYEKNKYRFGFSFEGQGVTGIKKHLLQGLLTIFPSMNNEKAASDLFVKSTQIAVDNTPAYVMIITKTNDREAQVTSGMVYGKLVLTAHSLGLVLQPPSQVLEEYPEMKEQYESIHSKYASEGGTIQMLVRIGKPESEAALSMRRDISELIEK